MDAVRATCEERTWQAFWQVVMEDRSPAEVGRELRMTVGAIYIAKSRVLKRLRDALSGDSFVVKGRPDS